MIGSMGKGFSFFRTDNQDRRVGHGMATAFAIVRVGRFVGQTGGNASQVSEPTTRHVGSAWSYANLFSQCLHAQAGCSTMGTHEEAGIARRNWRGQRNILSAGKGEREKWGSSREGAD